MDPVQMGKFLARLRKEAGLTQEALGQTLGVTNKTVSRWENGNYLPDLEMLQLLGARFGVSVDELIQGRRVPAQMGEDTSKQTIIGRAAPEHMNTAQIESAHAALSKHAMTQQTALRQTDTVQMKSEQAAPQQPTPDNTAPAATPFALTERIAYWKRKWLREHILALILSYALLCILLPVLASALDLTGNVPFLAGIWILLTLVFYITARNRMMIYVESRAFLP